jgi:hypothetical protein
VEYSQRRRQVEVKMNDSRKAVSKLMLSVYFYISVTTMISVASPDPAWS